MPHGKRCPRFPCGIKKCPKNPRKSPIFAISQNVDLNHDGKVSIHELEKGFYDHDSNADGSVTKSELLRSTATTLEKLCGMPDFKGILGKPRLHGNTLETDAPSTAEQATCLSTRRKFFAYCE